MPWLITKFVLLAVVIVVAGTYLTRFADRLADLTRLGRTLAGAVLLAVATSLPELSIGCEAALIPAPDLAVGDLLGSCLMNLAILAVLDLLHKQRGLMLSPSAAVHALAANATMLLLGTLLLALLVDVPWGLWRLSAGSLAVFVVYLLSLRLIYLDQRVHRQLEAAAEPTPAGMGLKAAVVGYLAATAAILASAPEMARTSDKLAEATGLGGTFFGTLFVGLVTSLPEISTSASALRMGAYDLVVGNIFGSNAFNVVALFGIDLFYNGRLLAHGVLSDTHAVTAAAAIVVTSVVTMGLLYRAEKRYWLIEPDAALVIVLVGGAMGLVYYLG